MSDFRLDFDKILQALGTFEDRSRMMKGTPVMRDMGRLYADHNQAKFRTLQTMDHRSPWMNMVADRMMIPDRFLDRDMPEETKGPGNPPPFVPVPVPVPVPTRKPGPASSTTADPEPGAASSESVDPEPSSDAEFIRRLMKPYNKGWRKGYED